jgi:hypothetical protein
MIATKAALVATMVDRNGVGFSHVNSIDLQNFGSCNLERLGAVANLFVKRGARRDRRDGE